ncbi:MAG: PilZ domain-containing protein [bacterium]
MNSQKGRDNRKYERVFLESRHLWNLSEGGAYIISRNPRKTGSILQFEYRLEHVNKTFKALAKVVRTLYHPNPKTGEPAGMALQFIKVSDKDRALLKEYLEKASTVAE